MAGCNAGESEATEVAAINAAPGSTSSDVLETIKGLAPEPAISDSTICLQSLKSTRESDIREAELACPMTVTDKVSVRFVDTDETYGCTPYVVAVAPKNSPREYVRIASTHGTAKEFSATVRLKSGLLQDRKSDWRNYGWPGNSPLDPCSELPLKVVSITCKVSGEPEFLPCEHDVEFLAPGLFKTEVLLKQRPSKQKSDDYLTSKTGENLSLHQAIARRH